MKTFEDLVEFLGTIPYIDEGGCAISALTMYRWLMMNGKRSTIHFFYDPYDGDYPLNEEYKRGEGIYVFSCQHAMLMYQGKFYDATNEYSRYCKKRHIVPEKMVVDAINNGYWSPNFKRENIKVIQKFTGVDLSDIKLKRRTQ